VKEGDECGDTFEQRRLFLCSVRAETDGVLEAEELHLPDLERQIAANRTAGISNHTMLDMLASLLPLHYNVDSCAHTLQKDLSCGERRFAGKASFSTVYRASNSFSRECIDHLPRQRSIL
jgi:hypothetical protein